MEKLEILKYPDERLKIPSIEVVDFGKEFKEFVDKLIYTMYNSPGGVGIAAPQVNKHIKTIIIDSSKSTHKENKISHGLMVLSNPKIIAKDGEIIIREGCMSVPDYTGNVKRAYWIKVEAQDINGNLITFDTEGFEAVVIQHELDHLEGKVFLERIISPKDLFKRKVYK
ncbi:peptide deformylase [Venenivibrio stagnispumantis]|uniref:Peptide deformylase n=1 Tax=Venenivibrio stagnispumantis TaxID=407998 RepID=A0AA46AF34_9AQUI|nr:peptide deformylase [Venenivibrio stagnispumantis]MCW4573574.1 peptide deformylase [Venenivibrio stagnispumantis]SMP16468.1 peptide deformylase [Venenivibrio stagnispumantis]